MDLKQIASSYQQCEFVFGMAVLQVQYHIS